MTEELDVGAQPKKGKGKIIAGALVSVLHLGNVGLGVTVALGRGKEAAPETKTQEPQGASKPMDEPGPVLALEPFVVHLQDTSGAHYLRVTIQLELDREESRPIVEARKIMVRDKFLATLSAKRLEELRSPEDRVLLREELLKVGQQLTTTRIVRAVYFTEFLTQ